MANVNLPAPVAFAGAALCLLGGYLLGAVAGPETSSRHTAEVVSFDPGTEELCLEGDEVADLPEAEDGTLCGRWGHTAGARPPEEGDSIRFVTMTNEGDDEKAVFIYGDVVP